MANGNLLTLAEVARTLGICRKTAARMVQAGILPAYRISGGRRVYVPRRALEALLDGRLEAKKDSPAGQGGG